MKIEPSDEDPKAALAGFTSLFVSGGMKVIFFGRFEIHDFFGGFSSAASLKKVLLHRVDFLPS
jgi:hypothetical protein